MLTAIPKSLFSWNFEVRDGDRYVADLDIGWWRESGVLCIDDESWDIGRENLMGGSFFLRRNGVDVVTADKPSAFRRSFEVTCGGHFFTLSAASVFTRRFILRDDLGEVGDIRPSALWTRRASIDLPDTIPIAVQVFMTWLVLILWKRQAGRSG